MGYLIFRKASSSNLFNTAYANDIWTIAIAGGEKIYADEKVIDKLNRGLADLIKRNPYVPKDKFVIGGFSAGGTICLRYAEYSFGDPNTNKLATARIAKGETKEFVKLLHHTNTRTVCFD